MQRLSVNILQCRTRCHTSWITRCHTSWTRCHTSWITLGETLFLVGNLLLAVHTMTMAKITSLVKFFRVSLHLAGCSSLEDYVSKQKHGTFWYVEVLFAHDPVFIPHSERALNH